MSANNQYVVVEVEPNKWGLYYNGCVDDENWVGSVPSTLDSALSYAVAIEKADEVYENDPYIEYGVRTVHYEELLELREDLVLESLIEEGMCTRCSDEYTTVSHGASGICDKDPDYVVNVIANSFKAKNPEYVGIVWEAVANGVLRSLGWQPGQKVIIDEHGKVHLEK